MARSGMWNLAATLLPQGYLFVVSIAAARFLGPDRFGRQSFIAFVELSLLVLLASGLSTALSRYVGASLGAGRGGEVRALARLSAGVAWAAAALAFVTLVLVGLFAAGPRAAWIFAGVFAAASILQRERNAVLTGFQRWREVTIGGLAIGSFGTVAIVVVLWLGGGISGIFAAEAAAAVVLLGWTRLLAGRALRSLGESGAEGAPAARMLRYAAIATVGVVLTLVVWRRSEFFFLAHYSGDAQIGFYSIAFASAAGLLVLPSALTAVLLPSIATLHGARDLARIRSAYSRARRLLIALSLPLMAGGIALGPEALRLVYGHSYSRAGVVLVILLVPAPAIVAGNLANVLLAATERLLVPTVVGSAAGVLNIALDFALIPRYDAIGAAIANSTAQLAASIPAVVYVRRQLGGGDWRPVSLGKAALAAAAAGVLARGLVAALPGAAGVLAGLAAGTAAFLALAGTLTMLSRDDAHWLDGVVGGALGGRLGQLVRFCGRPIARSGAL